MTPSLFESWEISDDLLTWTFKLPPDLKFQSGAALDAAMMAENFNLMRDPKKGQNSIFWPSVADARPAYDATTVIVTMKNPFTAFPETLATENSMPVNLRKREELGDDFGVTEADGTGPFTDSTYQPGTEVTVTKWADYPGSGTPWVNNKGAGVPRPASSGCRSSRSATAPTRSRPAASTSSRTRPRRTWIASKATPTW